MSLPHKEKVMSNIEGTIGPFENAGVPGAGTSEVQTLTIGGSPTGGTFKLAFDGFTTAPITWIGNDDAALIAAVDAALEALPNIGTGGVTCADGTLTNGVGTITITFAGNQAALVVPLITVANNSLVDATPATIAVVETTPGAGPSTNEVQTLTIAAGPPTGGTFQLEFDGETTTPITWSAVNNTLLANIDAALEALSNIGAGEVACAATTLTAGVGALTITFSGTLAATDVALITVANNSLTGNSGAVSIAETTPGVTADFRGAKKGAVVNDTTNGVLYINTGAALAPTWTKVGTQS
jgi:hypothetical protein